MGTNILDDRTALIFGVKQSKKKNWLGMLDTADTGTTILREDENDMPSATATITLGNKILAQERFIVFVT